MEKIYKYNKGLHILSKDFKQAYDIIIRAALDRTWACIED